MEELKGNGYIIKYKIVHILLDKNVQLLTDFITTKTQVRHIVFFMYFFMYFFVKPAVSFPNCYNAPGM